MATNTYVALSTQTLGSPAASVTFSSIPQGYTDLVLMMNAGSSTTGTNFDIRVGNGSVDTGTNYSRTYMYGNGSSANSSRNSNLSFWAMPDMQTNTVQNTSTVHIMNYSNTTTYKTALTRAGTASSATYAVVSLWRSTSAIDTVQIYPENASNFVTGSTFTIYGILKA